MERLRGCGEKSEAQRKRAADKKRDTPSRGGGWKGCGAIEKGKAVDVRRKRGKERRPGKPERTGVFDRPMN